MKKCDEGFYPCPCCREERAWLLAAAQISYHIEFREELSLLADMHRDLLLLDKCDGAMNTSQRCRGGDVYSYPAVLQVCVCVCVCVCVEQQL